jgi:hypothetical protein
MRIAYLYIFFFGFLHLRFAYEGKIPFMDPAPESPLRLVSFAFALIHFSRLPDKYDHKPWFRRKNSPKNMILNEYPNRSVTYTDIFFDALFHVIISVIALVCVSGFIALGICSLIERFIPLIIPQKLAVWGFTLAILITFQILAIRSRRKKKVRKP